MGPNANAAICLSNSALHLATSKRAYETGVAAAWVSAVLDGRAGKADLLAAKGLPVYLTRDIQVARSWLRANAKGNRRGELVARSVAVRLPADGVETPTFKFLEGNRLCELVPGAGW